MNNTRLKIRNKVIELLSGNTDFGSRVYLNRTISVDDAPELTDGLILVNIKSESSELDSISPKTYKLTLTLEVNSLLGFKDEDEFSIEKSIERVAYQIWHLLEKHYTLGDTVSEIDYQSSEIQFDTSSELQLGLIRQTFSIKYYEAVGWTEDELADFNSSSVSFDYNGNKDFDFQVNHRE